MLWLDGEWVGYNNPLLINLTEDESESSLYRSILAQLDVEYLTASDELKKFNKLKLSFLIISLIYFIIGFIFLIFPTFKINFFIQF